MEEFIKENENEFMEYIKFKKEQEAEILKLNNNISKIKSDIIANNIAIGNEPEIEIKKKKAKIFEIKEKIANLGVNREVIKIKDLSQSDKEISDFNLAIEIERLKDEQQKLENEIKEIINMYRTSEEIKEAQKQIDSITVIKNTIQKRIDEKRSVIEELIDRKIAKKEFVLSEISKRKQETISKKEEEIKEKERTLVNVIRIEFNDENSEALYKLKEETVSRLENELEQKRRELLEDKVTFKEIYDNNKKELEEIKMLKENLDADTLEEILDLDDKEESKEDESDVEEKNQDVKEDKDKEWFQDEYGLWDLREKKHKKTFKDLAKDKMKSLVNSVKGKFSNKEKEEKEETLNENLSLSQKIKYELQNPQINLNVKYEQVENKFPDDDREEK